MSQSSSSSQSSLSAESDRERANFIKTAKLAIQKKFDESHTGQQGQQLGSVQQQAYDFSDQRLHYGGKHLDINLNGFDQFAEVLKHSASTIHGSLTTQDKEKLFKLLPAGVKDKDRYLQSILKGDKQTGSFGLSPVDAFSLKLQNQAFSKSYQQYQGYKKHLQLLQEKDRVLAQLKRVEQLRDRERQLEDNDLEPILSTLMDIHDDVLSSDSSSDMSDDERKFYAHMHAEDELLTSGYTTISSNQDGPVESNRPVKKTLGHRDPTSHQHHHQHARKHNDKEETKEGKGEGKVSTRKPAQPAANKEQNASNIGKSSKSKTLSFLDANSIAAQQFSDPVLLEQILSSERFKNLKNHKNQCTLPDYSQGWIENYRRQEEERYSNPTRAWIYLNEDNTTSIVAPVIKKKTQNLIQKPRDHPQLYSNRPAVVTLLCLARDAASRLPDGVGTRADIIELIKHSQWLKIEGSDHATLVTVVSGALDRLHYEDDSCVKYDAEKKLWVYMHKMRTLDCGDWQPMLNDLPNSFDNNSYNPYLGTDKEHLWDSSVHIGTGIPQPSLRIQTEIMEELPTVQNTLLTPGQSIINQSEIVIEPEQQAVPQTKSSLISIRLGGPLITGCDTSLKRNFSSMNKQQSGELNEDSANKRTKF